MKLYLARHGEYQVNDLMGGNPLNERGKAAITRIANFLQPLQIVVDAIFHSGKLRAEQTAEILSTGFVCQQVMQKKPGLNPLDSVLELAHDIHHWEQNDLLLVGHMPFMSRLTSQLILKKEDKEIVFFQPGTLVSLEKNDSADWIINWVLNPALFNHQL
ncbi:MAG: phosphohistidine phosphatase SixA [Gammaproteobacteria bacterium]|nr:phosphohistidine phosphatase SixA [Gammaproteobacteria bacterium]